MLKIFDRAKEAFSPSKNNIKPKPASLLGLPIQLRLRIFSLVIPSKAIVEPEAHEKAIVSVGSETTQQFSLIHPLCQVNRQLRQECAPLWLGRNSFYVYYNRYHRDDGRWVEAIEPLWRHLGHVILQLDSPATRARKGSDKMLEATLTVADGGSLVKMSANLPIEEAQHKEIAKAIKTYHKGSFDKLDGRALVAMQDWLMKNVFVDSLQPQKEYTVSKFELSKVISA